MVELRPETQPFAGRFRQSVMTLVKLESGLRNMECVKASRSRRAALPSVSEGRGSKNKHKLNITLVLSRINVSCGAFEIKLTVCLEGWIG